MRTLLIASAATFALLGGAAQAEVVGHAGANYTRTEADVAGFDVDSDTVQIEGAAAFTVGGLGAQVDASMTDSSDIDPVWAVTGHLNTDLGGARVGGFVGLVDLDDATLWSLGVEGQKDLTASTVLYGQLGYGQVDDLDLDGWAVRGELRHFYTENFKITGSIGYLHADQDVLGDADAWNFGVEGEYKFAQGPISVFGGYQRTESDDLDTSADTFQLGVRYTFGGATLRARDAAGASLGSVGKLFTGLVR